jgi:hypothetical protein
LEARYCKVVENIKGEGEGRTWREDGRQEQRTRKGHNRIRRMKENKKRSRKKWKEVKEER